MSLLLVGSSSERSNGAEVLIFLTMISRKLASCRDRFVLSIFVSVLGPICQAAELPGIGLAERMNADLLSQGHVGGTLFLNNLADSETLSKADFAFVFVHGLWGHSMQFAGQPSDMLKLAERPIFSRTFNLPGHSAVDVSDKDLPEIRKKDKSIAAQDWSYYLETEIKIAKKYAKHVILIGQSTGGLLALQLLNNQPDLVDGVIAIDPALGVRPMLALGGCVAKATWPGSESWGVFPKLVMGQNVRRVNLGFGCEVEKLTKTFRRDLAKSFGIDANSPDLLFKALGKKFRGRLKVIGTELDQVVNPSWISVLGKSADPETFVDVRSRFSDNQKLGHGDAEYLSADLNAKACELIANSEPDLKDQLCFNSFELLTELIQPSLDSRAELDSVRAAKSQWRTKFYLESQTSKFSTEAVKREAQRLLGTDAFGKLAEYFRLQTTVYKKWNDLVDDNVSRFSMGMDQLATRASEVTDGLSRWPIGIRLNDSNQSEVVRNLIPYCTYDEQSGIEKNYRTFGRLNREHCILGSPASPSPTSKSYDLDRWEKTLFSPDLLELSEEPLKQICDLVVTSECENVVRAQKMYRQQLEAYVHYFKKELLRTFNEDAQVMEYLQLREDLRALLLRVHPPSSEPGMSLKAIAPGAK